MAYRNFARPAAPERPRSMQAWLDWMEEQGDILVPVAPRQPLSCTRCFGAAGYRDDGDTWSTCWACHTYGDAVDTVVPVTYSLDAGLESLLHQYKDGPVRWLRRPLASLLTVFVREHADCIEGDASGIDVAMLVPSDNQSRTFGHLDELLHGVVANDPVTRRFNWSPGAIVRDRLTKRPERGELKPRAYKVDPRYVSDASVLLLDDT